MITKIQLTSKTIAFRKLCLSMFPDEIDALTEEKRSCQLGDHTTDVSLIEQLVFAEDQKPINNIHKLVKTPRLLKSILRHCLKTWELLHGELDFDDLLVANVIRFAAPDAFEFMLSNCNELRGLLEDNVFNNRDERQKAVEKRWESVCSNVTWDTYAAKQLIQFLFYGWKDQNRIIRKDATPQGFQNSTPIDYWDRFIRGELRTEDRCDQEVLRSISLWHSSPNEAHYRGQSLCVSLYNDQTFATLFERFICLILDGHDYRRLFTQLFAYALTKHGAEANINLIPCFTELRHNTIRHPIDQQEHLSWLEEEIKKAIPVSLQLANEIFANFRYFSEHEYAIRTSDPMLRTHVVSFAMNSFLNNPRELVKTLSVHHADSCFVFSIYHSQETEGGSGFKVSEWQWFAKLMLDAAEVDPDVVTPQLVRLVVNDAQPNGECKRAINDSIVEGLFGSSREKLMSILAKDISVAELHPDARRLVAFAKEYATKWLAQRGAQGRES